MIKLEADLFIYASRESEGEKLKMYLTITFKPYIEENLSNWRKWFLVFFQMYNTFKHLSKTRIWFILIKIVRLAESTALPVSMIFDIRFDHKYIVWSIATYLCLRCWRVPASWKSMLVSLTIYTNSLSYYNF